MSESKSENLEELSFSGDGEEDEFDKVLDDSERKKVLEDLKKKEKKNESNISQDGPKWEIPDFERNENYVEKLKDKLEGIEPKHDEEKDEETRLLSNYGDDAGFYDYAEEEVDDYLGGSLISKKEKHKAVVKRKYYTTDGEVVMEEGNLLQKIVHVCSCGYW